MPATGHKPGDVRNLDDRRISRTRHAIDTAFLAELRRHGYDAVSVSDIVREANVGRATFYAHYQSKDDLLRAQLRRLLDSTLRAHAGHAGAVDATALFSHVRDVPMLYRLIAGRSGTARSTRVLSEALEERAIALLSANDTGGSGLRSSIPTLAAARVCAATLCALLSWWSEQGLAATADEMQNMFATCTAPVAPPVGSIRCSG